MIYSFNNEGQLNWTLTDPETYDIYGSPAIGSDSVMYYATPNGNITAIQ
jgi:outer membrane protein assembly factor BamB